MAELKTFSIIVIIIIVVINSGFSFFPHCPFWGEANVFVVLTLNHLMSDNIYVRLISYLVLNTPGS